MKAVYTDLHRSHDPQFFLVRGVVMRTTEQPERADRLLAGLAAGKHELVAPTVFGQGPRTRVHSVEYLSFLAEAWEAWSALGNAGPEMIANVHPVRHGATYPTHIVGRLGWHTADGHGDILGRVQTRCVQRQRSLRRRDTVIARLEQPGVRGNDIERPGNRGASGVDDDGGQSGGDRFRR